MAEAAAASLPDFFYNTQSPLYLDSMDFHGAQRTQGWYQRVESEEFKESRQEISRLEERAGIIEFNEISFNVDPGSTSRQIALIGIGVSFVFGVTCIILGVLIRLEVFPLSSGTYTGGNILLNLQPTDLPVREILLLVLNLTFVKLSVMSTQIVHETTLKWQLAFEEDKITKLPRLEFNSNLRFLYVSQKRWSANGLPGAIVLAACLAISYAASSMVILNVERDEDHNGLISYVAILVLGSVTIIQAAISTFAIYTTDIPTWSTSPFDTAVTLLRKGRIRRNPGRCMHSLYDRNYNGPMRPRERQPSGWVAQPQFRTLIMYVWTCVGIGFFLFFVLLGLTDSGAPNASSGSSWFPIPLSNSTLEDTPNIDLGWQGEAPTYGLLWGLLVLVGFQGGIITTAVTCAQAQVAQLTDEHIWLLTGGKTGTTTSIGFMKKFFITWQNVVVHGMEPVLHWLFGLAVSVSADRGFQVRPVPILYLCIFAALTMVVGTKVVKYEFKRPQPPTYGHLQTLVDLIDEWDKVMFWGHKWPGHAGTSCKPLEHVHMDEFYGGDYCDPSFKCRCA